MRRASKKDRIGPIHEVLDAGEKTLREIGFPDGKDQGADRATDRMYATAVACALWSNPGSLLHADPAFVRVLAASLARFVLDEYAVEGRPSLKKIDEGIATEYHLRVHHFGEKAEAAALDIAQLATRAGRNLTANRVKNIASENGAMRSRADRLAEIYGAEQATEPPLAVGHARLQWMTELNLMEHHRQRARAPSRKHR